MPRHPPVQKDLIEGGNGGRGGRRCDGGRGVRGCDRGWWWLVDVIEGG